ESRVYSYTVKKRADLIIQSPGISIGGQEQVIVRTMIKNNGDTDAAGFYVELFNGEPASGGMLIGEKTYVNFLQASADTVLDVLLRINPSGLQLFYVQLDQENRIDEMIEYNNFFSKQFQLLTIKNGSDGQVMTSDSNFAVTIPAAAVSFNTSFVIKRKTKEEVVSNYAMPQTFNPSTLADGSQAFYSIDLGNDEAEIIKPFSVSFFSNHLLMGSEPKIYCWDEKSSSWSYRASHVNFNEMKIYAETQPGDFLFGLFVVNDTTPPTIAIKVEDQVFANGDYVSSQPIISAVLEDESGVDIHTYPPVIKLNDQSVAEGELVCAQSPNSQNIVLLKYSPTLSSGEYELKIQAIDFAGNVGQEILSLKISGEFELQAIANHPNPFTEETIIAYTLTDEAREVKIKIYTASGRLIRTFNFVNEVGYIEHVWDGCDEFGDEVANGIYYMKFVASNGKKTIKRVEKMAKIR
ncbi:MAG: T9SS type A sorting domain-containing protein, partial [bacterium]